MYDSKTPDANRYIEKNLFKLSDTKQKYILSLKEEYRAFFLASMIGNDETNKNPLVLKWLIDFVKKRIADFSFNFTINNLNNNDIKHNFIIDNKNNASKNIVGFHISTDSIEQIREIVENIDFNDSNRSDRFF